MNLTFKISFKIKMNVIFAVSVLSYPKDEGRRKSESVTEYVAECVANFTNVTRGG